MASLIKKMQSLTKGKLKEVDSPAVTTRPVSVTKKASVKKAATKKTATKTTAPKKAVTKKTLPKKTAPKKSAPKTTKQGVIVAPPDKMFWLSNGDILDSLESLAESFALMDKLIYQHHVTKEKNDFANWVEEVLEDTACAMDLRRAKTPSSAKIIVVRHLKRYE
jgi:hypothetical protein